MIRYNTTANNYEIYNGAWYNLLGGSGGASQWTTAGSNIYYNLGNVGIGTAAPTKTLALSGQSVQTIWMERQTTAATPGNDLTVQAGGAKSGGTNPNGGNSLPPEAFRPEADNRMFSFKRMETAAALEQRTELPST